MEHKDKNSNDKNNGFPVNAVFCGCSVVSGAVLYLIRFTFDSFADYIFIPILAFLAVFIIFVVGAAVMITLDPEIDKFPKLVQKACVLLLIIGLVLAQYYLLSFIF